VKIEPAEAPSAQISVDFNSPVLGIQQANWDEQTDYAREIAPCRTFCFYKEIEPMLKGGLIKGGDLSNALVVTDTGYMDDPVLHFPDECGRHKLLDLLGDFRLSGGYMNARITAFKPGHPINTKAAKAIRALLK
jgi:UDP-3-O-[3-hydroxymyristoyl] N-acetylglucosamine deacetylase/3-hydroxyacyl-[acyl-carrier-protein] dehydratase